MGPVVRFWPKFRRLGPSDSHIRFFPVGCRMHKNTDPFFRSKSKNLKLAVRLHKNRPFFEITLWQYRVDVAPNLPERPVPVSMFYPYRYQLRCRRPHRYRCRCFTDTGTNLDTDRRPYRYPRYRYLYFRYLMSHRSYRSVAPNLPRCPVPALMLYRNFQVSPVPILMSYRTYRSVSGTGIDVVPNLQVRLRYRY